MFYSVVLLDGKELHCLSLEEVRELFFKRQINQDSLVCSAEDGQWKMLRRIFDVSEWISSGAASAGAQSFQPAVDPFEQTYHRTNSPPNHVSSENERQSASQSAQPETFNQFPTTAPPPNLYRQDASNGYSQNNQTETYYQAETNQTNYNFQNNQTNFSPSKYSNPAGSYDYSVSLTTPAAAVDGRRKGLRTAAVFLLINALFYIAFLVLGNTLPDPNASPDAAFNTGKSTGAFLPLIVDLFLAFKLWKQDNGESARKWVLARSYFGFAVFGVIAPLILFGLGQVFFGVFSFLTTLFYFTSLALVLHGKHEPPPSRIVIGAASFAVYFLIMAGSIAVVFVGTLVPQIANLKIPVSAQFEKYKIEGAEYHDKITGAKVVLPEGWSLIKLDNPIIRTPEARMIAVDKSGNRLTMFEVVPVPANLDMKRQNPALILDQLSDNVVKIMNEQVGKKVGFGGKAEFKEITRLSIYIGKHPAKLLVFEKLEGGEKVKGHMIVTFDELTFYVLHSWCPANEYNEAQNDFTFFEKNFSVPEKINSTFTQTAENQNK